LLSRILFFVHQRSPAAEDLLSVRGFNAVALSEIYTALERIGRIAPPMQAKRPSAAAAVAAKVVRMMAR
jgi:hypothetical protein